ncbi:MAG TPA: hypothetical protein VEH27_02425 [Methylomirabilota bacterium]|nr:hypothetical protein [Methylomirabilota bacterium]
MPKHVFTDQEGQSLVILKSGDYILEVVSAEQTISTGNKTRGCDQLELKLREQDTGALIYETLTFGYPALGWKIDTFMKSMGLHASKGEEVELTAESVIGLRGWATVRPDKYVNSQGVEKENNKVAAWITTKDKFPKIVKVDYFDQRKTAPAQASAPVPAQAVDDDVPF